LNLDHAEVFAALAVPGFGAIWRGASLRGDIRKEWAPRVEDAEVALADRATQELVAMQQEIAGIVGSGPTAVPRLATADPTPLANRAREFQKTLEIRRHLPADFRRLQSLGPFLVLAALIFLIGLAAVFVDSSELATSDLIRIGGLVVGGLGLSR
jgi:hypothetical protein